MLCRIYALVVLLLAARLLATAQPNPASEAVGGKNSTSTSTGKNPTVSPDTALREFQNASVAANATDPEGVPVACPLTSRSIDEEDMNPVKVSCDAGSISGKNVAGSNYCLGCGCALNMLAYKSLANSSVLNSTTEDDLLDSCAHWAFDEAVAVGAIDAGAVAALKVCAPIDFVCKLYAKRLNTSLITGQTEDQIAVLGGGISDAVQSAAGNATAAAAAAAHAARTSSAAANALFMSSSGSLVLLVLSALMMPLALGCLH